MAGKCCSCGVKFLRDKRHINENLKLGHNYYCSFTCQAKEKRNRQEFACENKNCQKGFSRAPHEISPHNFCSRSCAAIVHNNQRWGERPYLKVKLTEQERKSIRAAASSLGGISRWSKYKSRYTKAYVINKIKDFVRRNYRLPLKREMWIIYKPARKHFGTWNKAIKMAGFKSNPVMFADHQIAKDGHICDSMAEKIIDDYLFRKEIPHERNFPYPEGGYTADFKVEDRLIEYFGLAGKHKRYDEIKMLKQEIAKKYKLKVIEIYPKDLYSKNGLQEVLSLYYI